MPNLDPLKTNGLCNEYHLFEYHLLQAMPLHINILIQNKIFLMTQFAKRTLNDMQRFSGYEGQWGM